MAVRYSMLMRSSSSIPVTCRFFSRIPPIRTDVLYGRLTCRSTAHNHTSCSHRFPDILMLWRRDKEAKILDKTALYEKLHCYLFSFSFTFFIGWTLFPLSDSCSCALRGAIFKLGMTTQHWSIVNVNDLFRPYGETLLFKYFVDRSCWIWTMRSISSFLSDLWQEFEMYLLKCFVCLLRRSLNPQTSWKIRSYIARPGNDSTKLKVIKIFIYSQKVLCTNHVEIKVTWRCINLSYRYALFHHKRL